MKISREVPITTIAAEVPASRTIMEMLGIDYSCAGSRTLAEAADEAGLDPEALVANLRRLTPLSDTESWNERSLRELITHIVREHHRLVRDELTFISMQLFDLCSPSAHPVAEMQSLRAAVRGFSDAVVKHMHEEEHNIFRAIERMETAWEKNETVADLDLESRIARIVVEHGELAAQLRTIRDLRLSLEASDETAERCGGMLATLARLEAHLHEYMFLENCILFPRAVVMQQQSQDRKVT